MADPNRKRAARLSPMLHVCTTEGCTTIVFGRGPCVEHDRRRVPRAQRLLAEAVALEQQEEANVEAGVQLQK